MKLLTNSIYICLKWYLKSLRVIAIDTGKEKEQMCLGYGVEKFLDFKVEKDMVATVKSLTNGGAHSVIVTGG